MAFFITFRNDTGGEIITDINGEQLAENASKTKAFVSNYCQRRLVVTTVINA